MRPSLFEFAGGMPAFLALAKAHHARCIADPALEHPFTRPNQNPQHIERLAAYWAEVLGGPPTFSASLSDQTKLQRMHAGNGPGMVDLGQRFIACFVQAMDDAGLPTDPEFRAALKAYMEWAVADINAYWPKGSKVEDGLAMPRWSWDGLRSPGT